MILLSFTINKSGLTTVSPAWIFSFSKTFLLTIFCNIPGDRVVALQSWWVYSVAKLENMIQRFCIHKLSTTLLQLQPSFYKLRPSEESVDFSFHAVDIVLSPGESCMFSNPLVLAKHLARIYKRCSIEWFVQVFCPEFWDSFPNHDGTVSPLQSIFNGRYLPHYLSCDDWTRDVCGLD